MYKIADVWSNDSSFEEKTLKTEEACSWAYLGCKFEVSISIPVSAQFVAMIVGVKKKLLLL